VVKTARMMMKMMRMRMDERVQLVERHVNQFLTSRSGVTLIPTWASFLLMSYDSKRHTGFFGFFLDIIHLCYLDVLIFTTD